jgi:hypothetical protein
MDCNGLSASSFCQAIVLAVAFLGYTASTADAQHSNRRAYNPVTGRSESVARRSHVREPLPTLADEEGGFIEPASYCDSCACGEDCNVGCGDSVCCDTCGPCPQRPRFYTSFEATFVKPRIEDNVAFTTMEADGASFESFGDTEFNYDLEFTPRIFLGWQRANGVGHGAATASGNPPANGFGSVTHPAFGDVDISSVIPTDTFSAASDLNAYTLDIEGTKETSFCGWGLGIAGGVRYAYSEQSYLAELRDNANTLRGRIDYRQSIEGLGPTISLSAYRPIATDAGFFCKARGSVLFGDGESMLNAVEDADLTTPFNTARATGRDDLLSIGEIQLGFRWQSLGHRGQTYRPFLSAALESQFWNGAGNATSEDGSLGFFGFITAIGVDL